ncbi:hypothetical protein D3C79_1076070 [compost metagenome]
MSPVSSATSKSRDLNKSVKSVGGDIILEIFSALLTLELSESVAVLTASEKGNSDCARSPLSATTL